MSEAANNPRPKNSTLIRRFLPYMAKYRGVLAFDLFCAALTTLCDIALPSIMRTLTNTVSAAALTVDLSLIHIWWGRQQRRHHLCLPP